MTAIRKKYDRQKVDWQKAQCRGINTNIFFTEEESRYDRQLNQTIIRKMCFRCPIQKDCLEIGFEFEEFGSWGGVSSMERREIRLGRLDSRLIGPLLDDIAEFGLEPKEVLGDRYNQK
jgi:Transcription factor WhiB